MNVRDLAKAKIVIVGDAMIDRYIYGHWSKIGPEGVPVFFETGIKDIPGGAANVAANLEALGCQPHVIGKLRGQMPVKTRYCDHTTVFRSDREDCSPIDETRERSILAFVESLETPDVLVISDYAKGVCTPRLCRDLIGWAKANSIKVMVDPKGDDWSKYAGADVITPNEAEWKTAGPFIPDIPWVVETRGAKGMKLWPLSLRPIEIPATAREVYDVTGAGDTVVAILSAALAVGFDLESAARLANAAAGIVVGKRGTATCSLAELEAAVFKPSILEMAAC